jgi:ubiquinone/menaquinone biosynthesis C-methylase UbiE
MDRLKGWFRDRAARRVMRREWDERARQNARHYVATLRQDWSDEDFFQSGSESVAWIVSRDLAAICNGRSGPSDMTALEIGCGAGRMTLALSRIFGHVDAVDVSAEMIAQARVALRERTNVQFHVNNGADLAMFPNERFDFAVSAIVFQHIPRRAIVESYIKETWRVLRPNSLFKFQLQGCPITEQEADTWVGVGFSEDEMREIAGRSGFQIKDSHGAGTQYYWLTFRKP